MKFIAPYDTNAKRWSRNAVFVVRIVGGVAAVGGFFAGLWSVWGNPGRGVSLMGLGIILGVVFGRYPAGAAEAVARKKADAG